MVVRPAVYWHGADPTVITSEPCCFGVRRFKMADLEYEKRVYTTRCTKCKWWYELTIASNGNPLLGGLYGINWKSMGY